MPGMGTFIRTIVLTPPREALTPAQARTVRHILAHFPDAIKVVRGRPSSLPDLDSACAAVERSSAEFETLKLGGGFLARAPKMGLLDRMSELIDAQRVPPNASIGPVARSLPVRAALRGMDRQIGHHRLRPAAAAPDPGSAADSSGSSGPETELSRHASSATSSGPPATEVSGSATGDSAPATEASASAAGASSAAPSTEESSAADSETSAAASYSTAADEDWELVVAPVQWDDGATVSEAHFTPFQVSIVANGTVAERQNVANRVPTMDLVYESPTGEPPGPLANRTAIQQMFLLEGMLFRALELLQLSVPASPRGPAAVVRFSRLVCTGDRPMHESATEVFGCHYGRMSCNDGSMVFWRACGSTWRPGTVTVSSGSAQGRCGSAAAASASAAASRPAASGAAEAGGGRGAVTVSSGSAHGRCGSAVADAADERTAVPPWFCYFAVPVLTWLDIIPVQFVTCIMHETDGLSRRILDTVTARLGPTGQRRLCRDARNLGSVAGVPLQRIFGKRYAARMADRALHVSLLSLLVAGRVPASVANVLFTWVATMAILRSTHPPSSADCHYVSVTLRRAVEHCRSTDDADFCSLFVVGFKSAAIRSRGDVQELVSDALDPKKHAKKDAAAAERDEDGAADPLRPPAAALRLWEALQGDWTSVLKEVKRGHGARYFKESYRFSPTYGEVLIYHDHLKLWEAAEACEVRTEGGIIPLPPAADGHASAAAVRPAAASARGVIPQRGRGRGAEAPSPRRSRSAAPLRSAAAAMRPPAASVRGRAARGRTASAPPPRKRRRPPPRRRRRGDSSPSADPSSSSGSMVSTSSSSSSVSASSSSSWSSSSSGASSSATSSSSSATARQTSAAPVPTKWTEPHIYIRLPRDARGAPQWEVWIGTGRDAPADSLWFWARSGSEPAVQRPHLKRSGDATDVPPAIIAKAHHLFEHLSWASDIFPLAWETATDEKDLGETSRVIPVLRGRAAARIRTGSMRKAAMRILSGTAESHMQSLAQVHAGLNVGPPRPDPAFPERPQRNKGFATMQLVRTVSRRPAAPPYTWFADGAQLVRPGGLPRETSHAAVVESVRWTPNLRLHRGWVWGPDREDLSRAYLVHYPVRLRTSAVGGRYADAGGLYVSRLLPVYVGGLACVFAQDTRACGLHAMIRAGCVMWLVDHNADPQYFPFEEMDMDRTWGFWPFTVPLRGRAEPESADTIGTLWWGKGPSGSRVVYRVPRHGRGYHVVHPTGRDMTKEELDALLQRFPGTTFGDDIRNALPASSAAAPCASAAGASASEAAGAAAGSASAAAQRVHAAGPQPARGGTVALDTSGKQCIGPINSSVDRHLLVIIPSTHRDLYNSPRHLSTDRVIAVEVQWRAATHAAKTMWLPWIIANGISPERCAPSVKVALHRAWHEPLAFLTTRDGVVTYSDRAPRQLWPGIRAVLGA